MSFKHIIITRFSFRFKKTDPILPLLSTARLDERIRIFQKYCFPSIAGQTNKDFEWILIIDPELPLEYKQKLQSIFDEFQRSSKYLSHGPRKLWIHPWNWDTDKLSEIDWFLPYIRINREGMNYDELKNTSLSYQIQAKYLVTTRLDDDDCLHKNFIELVASQIRKPPKDLGQVEGFRYLSYCHGYQFQVNSKILKRTRIPLIALGLTLITEINKYPITSYLGCHTKIETYIRKPETHARMFELYKINKDLPVTHMKILGRLSIIRGNTSTYVRNVHGFNLQKNIARHKFQPDKHMEMIRQVMKNDFNVDIT